MSKTNKVILWIIAIIILLGLIWLGYSEKEPVVEGEVIKIGATLALSGNLAYIGEQELNGMNLAIEEINEKGGINGKKIELIVEDNQGLPKEAVSGVNKLISLDEVDIIFSLFTHITSAIKDIAWNNNKILFYASTLKDYAVENKYTFKDFFDFSNSGKKMAEIVNKLNYKEIAYLSVNDDACNEFDEYFKNNLNEDVEIAKEEKFDSQARTLKTEILKLDLKNVDVLATCDWRHSNIVMKDLKEMNLIDVPTIQQNAPLPPESNTEEMRKLFLENKTISVWYGVSEKARNDKQKEFFEKYKDKFGLYPSPDVIYIYDNIYIIAKTIERCNGIVDNDCFAENINGKEFEGVAEKIVFDENGNSNRNNIIIKINDNLEWEEVELEEL